MKFIIITLCVFLFFHISAYFSLIRYVFIKLKQKIISAILIVIHFMLNVIFTLVMLLRVDIPRYIYIPLSFTILIALIFFSVGIINIVLLFIFKNKSKIKILTSRIMFVVACMSIIFAIFNANRIPNLKKDEIKLANLKEEITILVITDLHLSKLITPSKVKNTINLANSSNADVIVLIGDIIDSDERIVKEFLPYLAELKAKYGVYFVLGNHEFIFNANKSLKLIKSLKNITTLVNENVNINNNINLIGVSDLSGIKRGYLQPNINKSLQGIKEGLPNILLSHQPNIIKNTPPNIDLILSGHTHGGQIFPFSIAAYFANPFLYGLKTINNIQLYISQGAHLAVTYGRLGTRAEINLLTLKNNI
ncbi:metallophosphoesterase [Helicobacter sp. MIT 14-3879]|uniref:metallophosphoesterase n=1 Tax=Helicobacter sp. MIT 14-3879 TaxID=2040649 RepID=UPI000E1F4C4C|nr:metallophosphoesterase [Helicobacter sp. MIT 14-3879]RDU64747.1 hypothetical protein CQA44_03285 [Helicobacter sp. MIT 14-3879]